MRQMIHWNESWPIKGIYDISEGSKEPAWVKSISEPTLGIVVWDWNRQALSSDIGCNVNIADVRIVNTIPMKWPHFFSISLHVLFFWLNWKFDAKCNSLQSIPKHRLLPCSNKFTWNNESKIMFLLKSFAFSPTYYLRFNKLQFDTLISLIFDIFNNLIPSNWDLRSINVLTFSYAFISVYDDVYILEM